MLSLANRRIPSATHPQKKGNQMASMFKRIDPSQYAHAWEDVPYCDQDPLQVVNIYTPGDAGDYPLLVYVNGGGWVQQAPKNNTVPGVWYAPSQGYALASVGYRLAPKWHWPAPTLDVKAAIRFLRAHAADYGYNADTIVAWGNSAGGHILGMCCATNNQPVYEDLTMGNADQSSEIQGFVSFYSPIDLYQMELTCYLSAEEQFRIAESPEGIDTGEPGMSLISNIELGCRALNNPAIAASASPINFVTKDFPPSYILHGLADPLIHFTQATAMYNKITYLCGEGRARLELFEGAGHGGAAIKADEVSKRVYDFADEIVFGRVRERPAFPKVKLLED